MPPKVKTASAINFGLPAPHSGQIAVRQRARRFNWWDCGRRWRKTSGLAGIALEDYALVGKQYIWTGPTYKVVDLGWDEILKASSDAVAKGAASFNRSRMEAEFWTGGKIVFRSLEDPDNARGLTADGIGMDEAAYVEDRAWYEVLRPMLMDTGGEAYFLFTPDGKNWTWREFMRAQEREDSTAFQIPSLGVDIVEGKLIRKPHPWENPNIPFSEMLNIFENTPERTFRQEYMAEFMDDAGGVFRRVQDAVMPGVKTPMSYNAGVAYQMGVDVARIHDYTVITVCRTDTLRQVYHERFNQVSWPRIYDSIARVGKLYNARCLVDATGVGDTLPGELQRRGVNVVPVKFNQHNKTKMVDHLASLIEHAKQPFLMDIPPQTFELEAYQYNTTPSGTVTMSAPKGEGNYDDCVTALVLCYADQHHRDAPGGRMLPKAVWPATRLHEPLFRPDHIW
jgi:hypothetical protein